MKPVDMSQAVAVTTSNKTALKDGLVFGWTDSGGSTVYLYIDDTIIDGALSNQQNPNIIFPISAGQTYKINANPRTGEFHFAPYL